ncbi:MAG: hypothetical protein KGH66_00330 [Candidatus Micrarchaeota archaeon]|nr:hypothetical protein [Candidatus Micrarchaeota archaeon]
MAYQDSGMRPRAAMQMPPHRRMHLPMGLIGVVVIVVLIVAGAYWLLSSGAPSVAISSPQDITVGPTGTVVTMSGAEYMIALADSLPGSGLAYVYVNRLPMFVNPIFNVTVSSASPTKLSTSNAAGYANMQLEAVSIGNKSIVLRVTPLDTGLSISPDYGKTVEIHSYFGNGTVGESLIAVQGSGNSTSSTTTTVPPVISSGSTTVASTTTVAQNANNTNSNIMAALKASAYYPVLVNLTTLYANTQQCSQADYNAAYIHQHSSAPQPPEDYANQSQIVPYLLYSNITNEGSGNYGVVYRTKAVALGDSPAMTITIKAATSKITNVTFSSIGVFQGSTGVGDLQAINTRAVQIGGVCGIEIP